MTNIELFNLICIDDFNNDAFKSPRAIVDDMKSNPHFVNKNGPTNIYEIARYVRNEYNLWYPDNPYTMKRYVAEIINGVDCNIYHPDNFSIIIVYGWLEEKLNETNTN